MLLFLGNQDLKEDSIMLFDESEEETVLLEESDSGKEALLEDEEESGGNPEEDPKVTNAMHVQMPECDITDLATVSTFGCRNLSDHQRYQILTCKSPKSSNYPVNAQKRRYQSK